MTLISLVGVGKDFGLRTLFHDLHLHLQERDRLGLIGPNGAGKSTLLRLLAGLEPPGEGERRCSGRLKVVMVAQEPDLDPERSVLEQVFEDSGEKMALLRRFTEVSHGVANDPGNQALLGELSDLQERMDQANAWSLEQQCREVLERLGIRDVHRRVGDLSGGSASGWPWPQPWWPNPMCSCSMNPPTISTPSASNGCRGSWSASPAPWC